ncbi:hypothetical protein BDA96_02G142400 [Sorghum bicolor]|uniref:Secreted protein n=1 Tax=Sorghum bicolor TaxID=4558 RepID=A0A921RNE3_SORBI|nr:hypothetical protein BDA96_02G142400 [Sorghum bicolor]
MRFLMLRFRHGLLCWHLLVLCSYSTLLDVTAEECQSFIQTFRAKISNGQTSCRLSFPATLASPRNKH